MSKLLARHAGALQLVFVVSVVGLALLVSAALEPDTASIRKSQPGADAAVSVVRPQPAAYRPSIELNGVVEARTMTTVIPQVGGRVVSVSSNFRPGATITAGELLFVIDPADYELAVERTLAEIEAARSELARLTAEAAAEREIWSKEFPDRPIPDLIARVPQIAAAKARVQSGQAARAAAELSLGRTSVRAPFDARVLETELDVGQVVTAGSAVGRLFAIDALEIRVPVSAADLALIGPPEGRSVSVRLDDHRALEGKVVRRSAALDERTRLASLYVTTAEKRALTAGEFVSVDVTGELASSTLRLPATALASQDQVWVVEDGRLSLRDVSVIGYVADETVVAAFDIGDGVVTVPPANIRSGLPVTIDEARQLASGGGLTSAAAD